MKWDLSIIMLNYEICFFPIEKIHRDHVFTSYSTQCQSSILLVIFYKVNDWIFSLLCSINGSFVVIRLLMEQRSSNGPLPSTSANSSSLRNKTSVDRSCYTKDSRLLLYYHYHHGVNNRTKYTIYSWYHFAVML